MKQEDGTLEMDEAPEDVIHFCFLLSVELNAGKIFILGMIFVTCISWNPIFSKASTEVTGKPSPFSCFFCSASLHAEKLDP